MRLARCDWLGSHESLLIWELQPPPSGGGVGNRAGVFLSSISQRRELLKDLNTAQKTRESGGWKEAKSVEIH